MELEATREAMLGAAPRTAGILLFGTHGLMPEKKEISYLNEPALVLRSLIEFKFPTSPRVKFIVPVTVELVAM